MHISNWHGYDEFVSSENFIDKESVNNSQLAKLENRSYMQLPQNSQGKRSCLKRSNYTLNITIFVSMGNLGQFHENW